MRTVNAGCFKPGQRPSQSTEFTRGSNLGEKNVNWKGDAVGLYALHKWLHRRVGLATVCVDCGSTRNVEWANVSKKYKRDIEDWKSLCASCHRAFDGMVKLTKEQSVQIRQRHALGEKQKLLAKEFGVDQSQISRIVNHRVIFYG